MESETVLSVYTKHDANVTLVRDRKIVEYIEVERLARKRYFAFSDDANEFRREYEMYVMPFIGDHKPTTIVANRMRSAQKDVLRALHPTAERWVDLDHHVTHAWSAYAFTAPCEGDLIISVDGTRDIPDPMRIFRFAGNELKQIDAVRINMGTPYRVLGVLSPEIESNRKLAYGENLGLAGKVMALAALGSVRTELIRPLTRYFRSFTQKPTMEQALVELISDLRLPTIAPLLLETHVARDLMATGQAVFEILFWEHAEEHLKNHAGARILLVGGCALNVSLCRCLHAYLGKEIFVPPCPNDSGSSIGAARAVVTDLEMLTTPFSGIDLIDRGELPRLVEIHRPRHISIDELASTILAGKVVGVVRGRSEIGPRALGHRSLLASPFVKGAKDKMNRIKFREFFRPVAPIVSIDQYPELFESTPPSPYMSFAPVVKERFRDDLCEVIHFDQTARVQTVSPADGFVYELVRRIGKATGFDVVMNTSFNSKGRPLTNSADEALALLRDTEIDCVYIDGYLFEKDQLAATRAPTSA